MPRCAGLPAQGLQIPVASCGSSPQCNSGIQNRSLQYQPIRGALDFWAGSRLPGAARQRARRDFLKGRDRPQDFLRNLSADDRLRGMGRQRSGAYRKLCLGKRQNVIVFHCLAIRICRVVEKRRFNQCLCLDESTRQIFRFCPVEGRGVGVKQFDGGLGGNG